MTPEILADPVQLTRALVDVESVSGNEAELADQVEAALRAAPHLTVERHGNVVLAGTRLGRPQRVILAGHLDTVPVADNVPSVVEGDVIHGCGTSDMKSGVALALHLAATVADPRYDVTYVFYDCEEVESERNGLNRLARTHPHLLAADFAILLEPTYGLVEAGCQGTLRARVTAVGQRAHSARSWLGINAIHAAGEIMTRLAAYEPRTVTIDGCTYREGLNAVRVSGGIAGNVIPDECQVEVNYRFAPDRTEDEAAAHVRDLFTGFAVEITDSAPAAAPGLSGPIVKELLDAVGQPPQAKLGWTDVARFATLGVPALNFGPGDPNLAHKRDERVEIPKIVAGAGVLRRWLSA
nr:succinyl-diaminopimelate desuccinylase [Planosporangium thailandense]